MSDLLDKQHIDAGLDLLRADGGLTVYPSSEGLTPFNPEPPYVRVYATIDRPADASANSLRGTSQVWVVRWICHCVGLNEYAAAAVGMRVRAALLDQRPTISGRNVGMIREDQALPPIKDDTTGRQVIDAVAVYRMTSA